MKYKAIQVCGTGSGVGKSLLVTGLCRIFWQDGYKTCPFKAQNMALNSFVTKTGGEIGRAQATQAQACCIDPDVDMNPVLMKPTRDSGAQIIIRGKPFANMSARQYVKHKSKSKFKETVRNSFNRLSKKYEIVVMEGAGSPAEINLKSHDIVNMRMAEYANAPVILVGDIDRGGVFAWLIGTLELLTKEEQRRVKGIIINKFRGDKSLLTPGISFLEKRTGIKVLGVVPYFKDIKLPEEDSLPLEAYKSHRKTGKGMLKVSVVCLPHISNFTDFDALEKEPDVFLKYTKTPEELDGSDMIIVPGTKNTISDLRFLKKTGFANRIISLSDSGAPPFLIGICGGYQILGRAISDRHSIESGIRETEGLKILPVKTSLRKEKVLKYVEACQLSTGLKVKGYEIHHGATKRENSCSPFFKIIKRNNKSTNLYDGAVDKNKRVFGTYIHGIFDNGGFRRHFLNRLRKQKGWPVLTKTDSLSLNAEFDKLARLIRENINVKLLYEMMRQKSNA